ncbi:Nitrite reductase [NAD(P)H] large subunit [hydrothermal vent metagenome]|uniref:Nitrite reductase [NAD(P)H] large subunit n=1 Tax=hydrothermal vent metagenome TaxID=652676 RepID=A0A3B0YM93_9ZZZZ
MSAVIEEDNQYTGAQAALPVVVVGTGPVGIHFVEALLQRSPATPVVVFGDEPWEPYNRVKLAGVMTGEETVTGIQNRLKLKTNHHVVQHHNCEIVAIDRENKQVIDRHGHSQAYSQLVLATGSSPNIPNIDGIHQAGIFTFRNLDDVQQLIARRVHSRRTLVLGGGLLGLEAARGMQSHDTEVFIIEYANHLMAQQLDDEAASLLQQNIGSRGIQIILGDAVKRITGNGEIDGVELNSGRTLSCDTLIVATGVHPNLELAREAGMAVDHGICVNDQMQTSDTDILAIGECAEHRNKLYGLVAPGLRQADIAARCLSGDVSHYTGSQMATRLKVVGVSVFSAGRTDENNANSQLHTLIWRSHSNNQYRKLLLLRNRLVGVIAYGDWDEVNRIQTDIQQPCYIWPWQRRRFISSGNLWSEQKAARVHEWPANAVVCQCTGVTRGTLTQAIAGGHSCMDALIKQTGASSVCGNCKPLLADLLGGTVTEPEKNHRTLVCTSCIALLAALTLLFMPSIPFADSVQTGMQWDILWRDSLVKQITGFSLLGLSIGASLISLRKRARPVRFGSFSGWRCAHALCGVLIVVVLVAHTGLRLGHYLNFYLMLSFIGLLLAGGIASGAIGLQHALPQMMVKKTREMSLWAHILLLWPLPALFGFHVFKTYWF